MADFGRAADFGLAVDFFAVAFGAVVSTIAAVSTLFMTEAIPLFMVAVEPYISLLPSGSPLPASSTK